MKKLEKLEYFNILETGGKSFDRQTGYPSIDKPWLKYYGGATEVEVEDISVYEYFLSQKPPLESIAIDYFGNKIPYKTVLDSIESAKKKFVSLGVRKGDVITLCSPSVPEVYYIFFAINQIGGILNLLDPRANIEFIEKSINDTNSKILLYIDAVFEKISRIKTNDVLRHIFYISVSASFPVGLKTIYDLKNHNVYKQMKRIGHVSWTECQVEPFGGKTFFETIKSEDTAAIVYTSGTTEVPKGALLSNKNIIALTVQNRISDFGWDRYDRFLEIMPPFIAFGYCVG